MNKATKFLRKIQVKNLQRYINQQYEKEGLSEEVLNKQIECNKLRHEYNITDETKTLHENYVQ